MRSIIFCLFVSFYACSCSVEKLINDNTSVTANIKSQNDTIINKIQQFNDDYRNNYYQGQAPDLVNLKKISFENFYFGEIISEEIIEKKATWIKVKVKEKIKLQNAQPVIYERTGWYSYTTPDIVYQISNSKPTRLEADLNSEPATDVQNTAPQTLMVYTTKPDLIDQKSLDMLFSQKALNFDGLKFDTKRFDYVNFSLGSFRGTYFLNSTLTNITGKREMITNDNDFTFTRFEGGTNKDWGFSFWKFRDCVFSGTTVENSKFDNCIFSSDLSGTYTFFNALFKLVTFNNTNDGYFKLAGQSKTTYEQCTFKDVKMYGFVSFETKFTACTFVNGIWQGLGFNNTQVPPSRITGGFFSKLKIIAGDYSKMIIEPNGGFKPSFESVEITNSIFAGANINAAFRENCKISGTGSFANINFQQSIFENVVFGSNVQSPRSNMQNCNFSGCDFQANTQFIKCDLRGATFPGNTANIQFIDCLR